MSLTTCLKKAGTAIDQKDKAAILARARELRGEGMAANDAAIQAVDERISMVQGLLPQGQAGKIEDFGEKLEGAKKDRAPSLSKELSDDDIASQPFSQIWPASEVDAIEDKFAAAVAFAARAEVTAKPRVSYKVKRWVEKVKGVRDLAQVIVRGSITREKFLDKLQADRGLRDFSAKVRLLEAIDRTEWSRIGEVTEAPDAYRYEDGKQIASPMVGIRVDGRYHWLNGSGAVADQVDSVNLLLGKPVAEKKMAFEVRGSGNSYSINKKGDKEYRKLKTFTTAKEALAYVRENNADLVAAWQEVKASDNVTERDVRSKENRPRTAKDYRNGEDVTPERFEETFGFRGVQFGNWVGQGTERKARQGMLNSAFDALMDLAEIVQVPPKALSLNGTLGLSFGARGSGWASAHFEPSNLVINLTKTRGAGTFAHEWFHALDNYFSRQRSGEVATRRGLNAHQAYREKNFITYRPEPMMVHKTKPSTPISKAALEHYRKINPTSTYYDPENWQVDPKHPQGVRPEVESAFAELVDALNKSPMAARARAIDRAPEGYWSQIIERGARSFENFVISKMMQNGFHNDYLANVTPVEDFPRSKERYPYLLPEEVAPIAEAFDNLFGTIQTKETDSGVALYSRPDDIGRAEITVDTLRTALTKRFGADIARMEARGFLKLWPSTQAFNDGQTSEHIDGPAQGYWDGKVAHLFADGIESGNEVAVLLHEVGEHASMKKMLGPEAYGKLVERAYSLVDAADPTAMRAVDRIPDDTPAHYKDSEFLAYMIEEAAADGAKAAPSVRKWLSDIVAAVRAWFSQTGLNKTLERFGKGIKLTPQDIAALAVRAVRWQAGNGGGGASAGQPSMALDQTQTPAFKRWFAGSKVVDGNGNPLVMYHGTNKTENGEAFTSFDTYASNYGLMGQGGYFTAEPMVASQYTEKGRGDSPTVYPVYLSIKNPIDMDAQADVAAWTEAFPDAQAYHEGGTTNESWYRAAEESIRDQEVPMYEGAEAMQAGLRSMGYDGIKHIGGGRIKADSIKHRVYVAFDPEQIKSATGNRGTFDGGNPDVRFSRPSNAAAAVANVFGGTPNMPTAQANAAPWAVTDPGRLDDFIRYIQNSRIDIKRTVDAVKAAGQNIADDANPYLQDELYIGKVRAQLDRLADESVKPLLQAIANSGFTPEQVNEYLWARHAEERNRQMAKVNAVPFTQALDLAGMSTADANTKLAAFQAMPEFRKMQAIARMIDQITTDARTKIVTDGLEDAGVIQAWEGAYKHYVPLQRDMEEAGGKASGYNVKGSESRRAVGSKKEAINILANVIAQAEATIIRSEKATVGRSVLDMARQHPNPDFWTVDTPPTERAIDPRTGLVTTRVKANYKSLDNVFTVKEAGVEHFIVFNEDNPRAVQFARTLKNMDAANLGPVMDSIAKVTRYLAQWVTSRNPLFWLTNFARDIQGVAFNLQSTPLKGQAPQVMANIPQALGGFARLNMGKKSGQWTVMAQRFKDAGGQTGYIDQYRDSVERMGDIIKEIEQERQSKADPRKIGRGVLAVLERANDAIENGVRLAVFNQGIEEGLSDAQAASIAKNISVNFNRKGNATAVYNALYMFMNANIQGNVRMIQGVQQSRRAQVYAGALTLAGAAVALMNLTAGGDDEKTRKKRYELVPEWERERNWIVFIPGTDDYVKIPLPLGPHVLFNAGRILAELGLEDGADPFEKASSFVSSMISAFNPIGGGFPTPDAKGLAQLATPTVARPVVDTVLNQNFAGIPITREGNPWGYNKPAYLNGRENTPSYWTTAAKAMNDWTGGDNVKPGAVNLSPEQLAYLVKGYVVPGIAQTADKVAGQAMSRKDTPMDQIVGVSKFFGSIDDNERRRAGYETLRRDEQFLGEYKNYIKAGEQEKARETLKKWGGGSEANGRKLLGQYNATDRVLSMYRKQKKTAGDEKLDEINGRIDRVLSVYQANTKDLRRQ